MDIEKLIDDYRKAADKWEKRHPVTDTFDLRVQDALREAATALSTLKAENEKLRDEMKQERAHRLHAEQHADAFLEDCKRLNAELEQVKIERDAAVECINTVYSYILIKRKTDAVRTIEKWLRGQKED